MADTEELPPEGVAEERTDAPETEQPQADPIAALASELGWVPKEAFRGDPEKWRPADEFIRAGRDIQQTTSRELKSVRDEMTRMSRVSAQLLEDKLAEQRAQWEARHERAVEDGDNATAKQAKDQLLAIERKAQDARPGPPPEVHEWVQRNPWFTSDPLAAARAREIADRLAAQGYDTPTQLRESERAIRKEFPELFETKPAAKQPPATQTAGARNAAPSNRQRGFADMPLAAQQVAADMDRRGVVKKEDYAAKYWADQQPRKVG